MDAFSRLLASIGQSLGKGLGQVGQTELEQRQRLEVLETQRRAQISSQLLQTFTQLLNTQGIQEVDPSGIDAIKKAVTDLALGRLDSPNVQRAIDVFPTVAASANKLSVYRELATRDIDALARLVYRADPKEAKSLLSAVGLGGLYDSIRARGEILNTADELGIQLTKEQIENLATQRRVMEAQIAKWASEMKLTEVQTKQILETLPLQLTRLQLEIAKGEKELARLDEYLDATIKGLNLDNLGKEVNIEKLKQEIKNLVLQGIRIEAETEETRARTEKIKAETKEVEARTKWVEEQTEDLQRRYELDRYRFQADWFKGLLGSFLEARTTNPAVIKALLTSPLNPFALPEEVAEPLSKDIAGRIGRVVTAEKLSLTDAVSQTSNNLLTLAKETDNPKQAREFAMRMLPEDVDPNIREFIGDLAETISTGEVVEKHNKKVKELLDRPPPPKVSESGLLRDFYDEAARQFGKAYANSIVNTIKEYWDLKRQVQELELAGKSAEIEKRKADALYNRALAAAVPEQTRFKAEELRLKREELDLEKWYKEQLIAQGWAKIRLEELEAQARAAGNQNIADVINKLATGAKTMGTLARDTLAWRLHEMGMFACANAVAGKDAENLAQMIAGIQEGCGKAVESILQNPNDYAAQTFWSAVEYQRRAISIANALIGGEGLGTFGTVPGTTQPGGTTTPGMTSPTQSGGTTTPGTTPGGATPTRPGGATTPGGATPTRPGGTTTQGRTLFEPPKRGPFEAGVRQNYNTLFREFRVKRPEDIVELGAMIFTFGNEFGPSYNPFQVTEGSGVKMIEVEITLPNGTKQKVKRPVGQDLGFREVIKADTPGTRKRAMDIDSAIAFGISWIFPNEARKPRMSVSQIREDFRRENKSLFDEANYFKSESGVTDIIALAAAYATRSLMRLGVPVSYTTQYTKLMRALAEHDLETLTSGRIPSKRQDEQAFLDKVERMYGNRYQELRFNSKDELREAARSLYWATRLSEIGNLAIGGGR